MDPVPLAEPPAPMERPTVPEADRRIGVRIPVLSHGFVVLVDYMGNDSAIVQAARVSYGKGTKSIRDDRGLIRYLMRHRHTTPFEMVEIKFLIRLPIYVARQMVRHRTANLNEFSARFSVVPEEFDLPPIEDIRQQSTSNRQGRGDAVPAEVAGRFRSDLDRISQEAYRSYQTALEAGIARETARLLLPLAYYTEWYWKIDLWNLFHFLSLRLDPHSQEEIRRYAAAMAGVARAVAPVAYEAFEDFALEGLTLSRPERIAVRALLDGADPVTACAKAGLPLTREDGRPMKTGEGVEFMAKLERIRSPVSTEGRG
ncbi:MAG: FAD-dependent thymidylate synthase [Thermoplasmata archaeon]|nr:FAD-dependent thymidylate synthase [Thermoplasmata archaeon]MCI4359796.1 FAD-dependent thymidylate synthase [Thermoplasmata archaeon]